MCIVTKNAEAIGSCGFIYNIAQCLNSLPAKFNDEIRRGLLEWRGLILGWSGSEVSAI